MPHVKESLRNCIHACTACHHICQETLAHCLEKGGRHADPAHIRVLMDCSAICATSADFMLRNSEHYVRVCAVCAEICDRCAASCEAFGDDPEMRRCAEACRRCAESCRQISA